jgi:hypothetical protein
MQTAGANDVSVDRYFVRPQDGIVVDVKTALVVFYDTFGFSTVRPTRDACIGRGVGAAGSFALR